HESLTAHLRRAGGAETGTAWRKGFQVGMENPALIETPSARLRSDDRKSMTQGLVHAAPEARFRLSFVLVGPQRTGTTWFHEYLATCPDAVVPTKLRAPCFFH